MLGQVSVVVEIHDPQKDLNGYSEAADVVGQALYSSQGGASELPKAENVIIDISRDWAAALCDK
ncbi:hypothetical protein ACLMJK_003117 [Lecanora helva]